MTRPTLSALLDDNGLGTRKRRPFHQSVYVTFVQEDETAGCWLPATGYATACCGKLTRGERGEREGGNNFRYLLLMSCLSPLFFLLSGLRIFVRVDSIEAVVVVHYFRITTTAADNDTFDMTIPTTITDYSVNLPLETAVCLRINRTQRNATYIRGTLYNTVTLHSTRENTYTSVPHQPLPGYIIRSRITTALLTEKRRVFACFFSLLLLLLLCFTWHHGLYTRTTL